MTDLRKAAEMALVKLEHLWEIGIDAEFKVELTPEIAALRQALAQPEQKLNDPPAYVEPPTSDYHNGWEEGFEAAKNLFKKESAPQNADPRLLLVRKDNCIALAQPEQSKYSDIVSDGGLDPRNKFDAQPEQEEPLAWATFDGEGNYDFRSYEDNETYRDEYIKRNGLKYANWVKPLYTAPPKPDPKSISTNEHLCAMLRQVHDVLACTALPMKRKWVGLTDEEIKGILDCGRGGLVDIKKAEQILKEKNGGNNT